MRARSLFAVVVAVLLAAASPPTHASGSEAHGGPLVRPPRPYLRVAGSRLIGADGREVKLRGVNLGGWLVTEDWMCGIADSRDTADAGGSPGAAGRFTQETLEARFGQERAKQLHDAWLDHWITGKDLDGIRAAGFNVIRVPFSYRTLQDSRGRWMVDARGNIDFSRMDWIVAEASRRGLYTIFDLHVWPEQRYAYTKIGRPEGAGIRRAMSGLWTTIAAHYRGDGAIAGFDLINELPGAWGVQQMLSDAVRAGDPDRVQIIGGYSLAEFLKLRRAGVFRNSVFSEHLYDTGPLSTQALADRLQSDAQSPVPVYVGEFLAQDFTAATNLMDKAEISWSSWTYKTVDMGDWGLFNYYASLKVDVDHDEFSDILAKWTTGLVTWQNASSPANAYVQGGRRLVEGQEPSRPLA